jgi:hypothetical protein
MTEHFISMFIDDELDLDEKIEFVETLHSDASYKTEAVTLLRQEKRLRDDPVQLVPPAVLQSVSPGGGPGGCVRCSSGWVPRRR